MRILITTLALALLAACGREAATRYDVEERSIAQLQADMTSGAATSEQIVQAYLDRIAAIDDGGPALNAVIALNPNALAEARALDAERRAGRIRGPLHGIRVLIKDNIETADPIATTAGSLALAANVTGRDAPALSPPGWPPAPSRAAAGPAPGWPRR